MLQSRERKTKKGTHIRAIKKDRITPAGTIESIAARGTLKPA